jgi:hypothetical protein
MWEKSERQTDRHGQLEEFFNTFENDPILFVQQAGSCRGMNKKIRPFLNKRDRVPSFQLNKT